MTANHKNRSEIETHLEKNIVQGLKFEWRIASHMLSPNLQAQLRMPIFQLKKMEKWAVWSPAIRTISFSKAFAFNYQWKDIVNVLRHEMAHLIAHEIFHAEYAAPHGPEFQKACALLCADPRSTGSYVPLQETHGQSINTEEDKIRLKIQKLLSLAQSPHQAEAEAACSKANALLLKYNLKQLNLRTPQSYTSLFITPPRLRHSRDRHLLACLLMEYFFVECVWSLQWVVAKNRQGRALEISGRRTNIETAHYAFDFITNFIDLEWKRFVVKKKPSNRRKVDFAIGVVEGFREKLNKERTRYSQLHQISPQALVAVNRDPHLKTYLKNKYKNLSSQKMGAKMIDRQAYDSGHKLGLDLVIHKGLAQDDGWQGRYLPN